MGNGVAKMPTETPQELVQLYVQSQQAGVELDKPEPFLDENDLKDLVPVYGGVNRAQHGDWLGAAVDWVGDVATVATAGAGYSTKVGVATARFGLDAIA